MYNENIYRLVVDIFTKEFVPQEDMPNKEYLESYLTLLNGKVLAFRRISEDISVTAIERASARDLEQNCIGLINGIKFGIAFLDSKSIELIEKNSDGKGI
jgi:hypothetical protein